MSENPLNMVNKWSFPGLIKIARETSFTEHNIQSSKWSKLPELPLIMNYLISVLRWDFINNS